MPGAPASAVLEQPQDRDCRISHHSLVTLSTARTLSTIPRITPVSPSPAAMTKRRGERRSAEAERYDLSPRHAERRESRQHRRRSPSSSSNTRSERSRSDGASLASDNSRRCSDREAPDQPPSWMKQLIGSIHESTSRIQILGQNMAQEVQSVQQAISTTEKNVHLLNSRLAGLEETTQSSISEAVNIAVDLKMSKIDAALAELKSTPTPRSSNPVRAAPEARQEVLERAHRVIIVGFPRKMMQTSLRRAADLVLSTGIPQGRERPTVRTYDMTKKIVLDFPDATTASDFLNMMHARGSIPFQDPIYPQQQILLRAKRDMAPGTRLLFLAMGKVRGALSSAMQALGKDMGSNGLGGDVYVLRGPEDPVQLCHLALVNAETEPTKVGITFFPDQFAEFSEIVTPLLPRLRDGIDHLNASQPF